MSVEIQFMPGNLHHAQDPNALQQQSHAGKHDDLPQEIMNMLHAIADPNQSGMTDQQKMDWQAIARMIGNQFKKDMAANVGGSNSQGFTPDYGFNPMQQSSMATDDSDDGVDSDLDNAMPDVDASDDAGLDDDTSLDDDTGLDDDTSLDDDSLPDDLTDDQTDDDIITPPQQHAAQSSAPPQAATATPAATPAPAAAEAAKPQAASQAAATTEPQSVDGGGPNSITVQNTTDKPMQVAFFKNLQPGEHPNFTGAEKTFTIPPHSSTDVSMPADWQGRVQKYNGSTQDKSNWAEVNFEQKTGKIWFDESDIPGRNASMTISSDDGQVAGINKSIINNAPANLIKLDQAGEKTIDAPQDFTGKTNQDAVNLLDNQIGTKNAYVLPDDNNAVRVSNSKHLTVALGDG